MAEPAIIGIGEALWDLLPGGARLGGAPCNFAFHCRQLGHEAVIVSRVGIDDLGVRLRAELTGLAVPDDHVQTDPIKPTGTVKVELDHSGLPTYSIVEDVAYDYVENAIVGADQDRYPAGNFFPGSWDEVGFVDAAAGDYTLDAASPYAGAGSDGRDLGADMAAIAAATAGVVR